MSNMAQNVKDIVKSGHHEQLPICNTRPAYRQGRKFTAVKVYTISDESRHLLLVGVPAIGLHDQVKRLCQRYGDVLSSVFVPNYAEEEFSDVFHVHYSKLQSSRFAKRQLDGKEFYGGILHVCYVPEMETVQETRQKLVLRRREVAVRCSRPFGSDKDKQPIRHYERKKFSESSQRRILNPALIQCIWKGQPKEHDPRRNAMLTNTGEVYGPQLPYWKVAGVRERYLQPKPLKNIPPVTTSEYTASTSSASTSLANSKDKPAILRFIPSQVKGVQKRIIRHHVKKVEEEPVPTMNDKSLDSTVQSIRDRIRSVSVPNIEIHLSRKNEDPMDIQKSLDIK